METNCRYCGRKVEWRKSKAGNTYLAESLPIYNEDGRLIKVILPAHRCNASVEERAAIDEQTKQMHEAAIESGEIVKGQSVVVVKGRKIAIGTTGVVTWVAAEQDQFDVWKVRVKMENGESFYINKANLEAKK